MLPLLLLACEATQAPIASDERVVELILDRGHREDEAWISEPVGDDHLVDGGGERSWATLRVGPGLARVDRGCGVVEVPYELGNVGRTVVLPYPACSPHDAPQVLGVAVDRREATWAELAGEPRLWPEIPVPEPGQEDGPARYLTYAEAQRWCAWNGGRLPTATEWEAAAGPGIGPLRAAPQARGDLDRSPTVGPLGHEDLLGNVEEWLEDGRVAGGSWLAAGRIRAVPLNTRAETIGVRCAWP